MRVVTEAIQHHGRSNSPRRGPNRELTGVLLELTNPRARLSRTETRGRPFSCLGELCWYLAASNDVEFIAYYISRYREEAEDGVIFGAYGPRLFGHALSQFTNVTQLLRDNNATRRAVIQLFAGTDIAEDHHQVPCTCTLQFLLRDGQLHLIANMRSNDVVLGLPHDIFCFTMLQEIMARALSVEVGGYKHAVGSLHLYDENQVEVHQFLEEGLQSTEEPMPEMPIGSPTTAIHSLLKAEREIRTTGNLQEPIDTDLAPYWMDLVRLLQVYRYVRDKKGAAIDLLRSQMASAVYRPFITKQLSRLA